MNNWNLIILILTTSSLPFVGKAQTNAFPTNGNVGIGTITPLLGTDNNGIQIHKGDHSSILLGDPIGSGYGGIIQTSDARHRVFIGANLYDDVNKSWSGFKTGKGSAGISVIADKGGWGSSIYFYVSDNDKDMNPKLVMNALGNVGIGTENPQAKLAVNGNILANELKIKTDITVPDYVFEPGYKMNTLEQIEEFVKTHKHLPEIPSAKEIEKEGLNVAEMNLLLLKKMEEMTLQMIQMNKTLVKQTEELSQLKENRSMAR